MLFDSHAHINYPEFSPQHRNEICSLISNSAVDYVMDVGCDLASSRQSVMDAKKYPWCYASVGYHPHDVKGLDDITFMMIEQLAREEKVKAIGEIGLDYYRDLSPRDEQQYWFRRQIQLANKLKMPIIIHTRDAMQDTVDILNEEGAFSAERKAMFPKRLDENGNFCDDARVLFHCYSGSAEDAKRIVKLGGTISIAGPVTFKNNRKTVKVVEEIPSEFLLAETDSPFLTPEPHRGKENISVNVEHTVAKMAEIKGISYDAMAQITKANAMKFFDIHE